MAERESIARSCELGADVLETESLIKRHDDFGKYLTANGSRLEALQTIAIQREEESHSNAEQFQSNACKSNEHLIKSELELIEVYEIRLDCILSIELLDF